MEINRDKIAYLPGLLAHKLGIGKGTLMRHLRETGLIEKCWRTKYSWRIPYEVAVQIASPEILAGPPPGRQKRSARRLPANGAKGQEKQLKPEFTSLQSKPAKPATATLPDYRQIGKMLRAAGVTMPDLIKYIEKQMEVVHEQSPYNLARRDENQAVTESDNDGNPPTPFTKGVRSASTDIPNSSAK